MKIASKTIIIPRKLAPKDDLVVIPRKEFEYMKSRMIPNIFLKGRAAGKLDRRVGSALKEYRSGKTKEIHSLADLD